MDTLRTFAPLDLTKGKTASAKKKRVAKEVHEPAAKRKRTE